MYSSKFLKAFERIVRAQSELTRYGLSESSYPRSRIKKVTLETARRIYFCDFWIKGKFEKIDDEDLAIRLFDLAVQIGVQQTIELIQRILQASSIDVGDAGIIAAINSVDSLTLLATLKSEIARQLRHEKSALNRLKGLQRWGSK